METQPRKTLPHGVPLWIDPQKEIYFITINCKDRFRNQLALPEVSRQLFETVRHRQDKSLWWPHIFLLMPDHFICTRYCRFRPQENECRKSSANGKIGPPKKWASFGSAIFLSIGCDTMKAIAKKRIIFCKTPFANTSPRIPKNGHLFILPMVSARIFNGRDIALRCPWTA